MSSLEWVSVFESDDLEDAKWVSARLLEANLPSRVVDPFAEEPPGTGPVRVLVEARDGVKAAQLLAGDEEPVEDFSEPPDPPEPALGPDHVDSPLNPRQRRALLAFGLAAVGCFISPVLLVALLVWIRVLQMNTIPLGWTGRLWFVSAAGLIVAGTYGVIRALSTG